VTQITLYYFERKSATMQRHKDEVDVPKQGNYYLSIWMSGMQFEKGAYYKFTES